MLDLSLSPATILALLGTMLVLALIPSVSVLAVSARAAAFGFTHGMFTAIGIVVADIIFILIAVYGLAMVSELMGDEFRWIQYIGGIYLLWLGMSLWRSKPGARTADRVKNSSLGSSFLTGFLITVGDQKAILFYLGFFPAFIDLGQLTTADILIVIVIAVIGVGGAKLVYAYLADRASLLFSDTRAVRGINMLAGGIIMLVGVALLLKAQQWI